MQIYRVQDDKNQEDCVSLGNFTPLFDTIVDF